MNEELNQAQWVLGYSAAQKSSRLRVTPWLLKSPEKEDEEAQSLRLESYKKKAKSGKIRPKNEKRRGNREKKDRKPSKRTRVGSFEAKI